MKRFYKKVTTGKEGEQHTVLLDGRAIRTPAKAALHLPTEALAGAIAAEWDAQEEKVAPATMPLMQAAATAIDRVTPQRGKVIEDIAVYGGTDLVCYRANHPENLVERQKEAWDPLIDWIRARHGVSLEVTTGIAHVAQSDDALHKMHGIVAAQNDMTLAALYNITSLCGSLVVALAVLDGHLSADEAFEVAELDETHVMEFWGKDAEAVKRRKNNKESLVASTRFLQLCDIIA